MKRMWLVLCLLPAAATAENLYRCVGGSGTVSYQAQPCGRGMRMDKRIAYVPERPGARLDRPEPRARQARVLQDAREPTLRRRAPASPRRRTAVDDCAAARAKRERALDSLGLKRTYAQLSLLDGPVRSACNGY